MRSPEDVLVNEKPLSEILKDHADWIKTFRKTGARAVLRDADLHEVDLVNADLRSADLRGANLAGASLRKANLAKALIEGVNLAGADIRNADFEGVGFYKVNLLEAENVRFCDFTRTNFALDEKIMEKLRAINNTIAAPRVTRAIRREI